MNVYRYTAKTLPGTTVTGTLRAASPGEAFAQLVKDGLFPLDIHHGSDGPSSTVFAPAWSSRVNRRDILIMTRQLANLALCDLPIVTGLTLLAKRSKKPAVKALLERLVARIEDGAMLSQALGADPTLFSSTYGHMVAAGELSGQLAQVLTRLADGLEAEAHQRAQIRSALYYPVFVLGVGILTIAVMLAFVVPKMAGLFDEFRTSLPLTTRLLLKISYGLRDHAGILVLAAAVMGSCLYVWVKSVQGREKIDRFLLRLPLYGDFLYQTEMTRLWRTMAMLLQNGVAMTHALNSARDITANVVLKSAVESVQSDVAGGASLSQALKGQKLFDETATGLIQIGEESGDLTRSLDQLAILYERETSAQAAAFLSLLGPALLVVIVGFTGFVVTALLVPIVQMDVLVR